MSQKTDNQNCYKAVKRKKAFLCQKWKIIEVKVIKKILLTSFMGITGSKETKNIKIYLARLELTGYIHTYIHTI